MIRRIIFHKHHVLLHGIQKKSQKIPKKEIIKAKSLRQEYYIEKKQSHEKFEDY